MKFYMCVVNSQINVGIMISDIKENYRPLNSNHIPWMLNFYWLCNTKLDDDRYIVIWFYLSHRDVGRALIWECLLENEIFSVRKEY